MIVTSDQIQKLIDNYVKGRSVSEMKAYINGIKATLDLVDRLIKEEKEQQKN